MTEHARLLIPVVNEIEGSLAVLRTDGKTPPWINGAALRFYTDESPAEIGERLATHLEPFELWTIHDGIDRAHEPFGGVVSLHFANTDHIEGSMAQIFVRYRDGEHDTEQVSEQIRGALGESARRVFHFRNGCVFMIRTKQPVGLIVRRFERIHRRIHSVVVTGYDGSDTRAFPDVALPLWFELP